MYVKRRAAACLQHLETLSENKKQDAKQPEAGEARMRKRKRRKWRSQRVIETQSQDSMFLLLVCVLMGALSTPWDVADCQSVGMMQNRTSTSNSTGANTTTGQMASLSSNMTAYMSAATVQTMANSSLTVAAAHSSGGGGGTSMSSQQQHQQQQQQQVGVKSNPTASTKGGGRSQNQIALAGATNSPAFNSRQRLPNAAGKQMRTSANASQGDNQMAADDAHETQAFMPSQSAIGGGGSAGSAGSDQSQATVSTSNDAGSGGGGGKSIATSGSNGKSSAGNQGGWQTVSTSIASPGRPRIAVAPKYSLPPPPPPLNYNNYAHQNQLDRATVLAIARAQQQQQQQQQQQLAADLEATQLERPASGYSYGTPAYTHTSPLGPAKHQERQRLHLDQQLQMHAARQLGAQQTSTAAATANRVQSQSALVSQMHVSAAGGTHATNPCKPLFGAHSPLSQQQQHEIQLLAGGGATNDLLSAAANGDPYHLPRYLKLASGTRLRSHYIFKVRRADSLTDCELLCSQASLTAGDLLDTCRSFNYRPQFAAENCELSRSDARSLKPEDSSQFEHNTHSDFYALDPSSQPLRAPHSASLLQQQQQQQVSLGPDSLAASDCLDVSQSCTQDGMEFTLRTNEPFRGRIYTYGFYDSCYFDGDGGTTSVLRISRSGGLPRCGTQQIGDLMTNIVVVQFNDFVQTTRDKKYNLTCNLSGPGEAVVTSDYLDTKIDERQHPTQVEHLPPQNVITSNVRLRVFYRGQPTNTIAVGDLLTFRLETSQAGGTGTGTSTGGGIKQSRAYSPLLEGSSRASAGDHASNEIFATNVLAKDPYSGRQVQLIDGRGCPVDPVNVFPELQRTPDGALESEFYAFKIPDSNFLIFQATVRTCKSPCEPVICQGAQLGGASHQMQLAGGIKGGSLGAYLMAPHQSSAPSWGRRRRKRSGEDEDASELIGTGESVEHVISARLGGNGHGSGQENSPGENNAGEHIPRVLTRIKRPDYSEAEEEVKEMFRVYLSRAEMNNKKRTQQLREEPKTASPWQAPETPHRQDEAVQVCLTQTGYYAILFCVISLSLVILSVLLVAFYVTRHAKFHISETLADSIF